MKALIDDYIDALNTFDKTIEKLTLLRNAIELLKDLPIIVGGSAFKYSDNLWRLVGADGYAENSVDAVQLVNSWWDESTKGPINQAI